LCCRGPVFGFGPPFLGLPRFLRSVIPSKFWFSPRSSVTCPVTFAPWPPFGRGWLPVGGLSFTLRFVSAKTFFSPYFFFLLQAKSSPSSVSPQKWSIPQWRLPPVVSDLVPFTRSFRGLLLCFFWGPQFPFVSDFPLHPCLFFHPDPARALRVELWTGQFPGQTEARG